jgi:hypothetical protein
MLMVTPFGAVTSGAVDLTARARLVVEIAAIFGYEPADPARAAEILTVLRAYADTSTAGAAVEAVLRGGPAPEPSTPAGAPPLPGPLPLVALGTAAGARLVRKTTARYVPGSALVMAVLGGPAATADVGQRAIRLYRAARAVAG